MPPTHKPERPAPSTAEDRAEHRRQADKFAPRWEDEQKFMTVRPPEAKPSAGKMPEAPKPRPRPEAPRNELPTTNLRGPTPDEILADPLVRTVLDVFEGEVKRVHPRPRGEGGEETERRRDGETE